MENGKTKGIAIANLVRWDKNPRPQTGIKDNADIAPSIETKGVLLPLIVRAKKGVPGVYEVIAGDRRRTTVQALAESGVWDADRLVPCLVRTDLTDDADALDVATSENLHLTMHPMDQFSAFYDMVEGGKTIQEIANAYGITTKDVEKRLKYAKLDPRARALVREDLRDLSWAAKMTMASADEQTVMLDEIEKDPNRYRNAMEIARRLETELVPIELALFDSSVVGDNLVRKDIFDSAEPSYLPIAEFLRLQDDAVDALVAARKADGWARVNVVPEREFDRYQYVDGVEEKGRGEVVIVRHPSGAVVEHAGLALRAEALINKSDSAEDDDAGDALFGEGSPETSEIREMVAPEAAYGESKATVAYLEKNRALVVQAMLMGSDRRLTHAVMIIGMLSESAPKIVEGRLFSDMKAIDPENRTRTVVDRQIGGMHQRLQAAGVSPSASYDDNVRALMKLEEDQLLSILQVMVAMRVGTAMTGVDRLFDVVSEHGDVALSTVWRPDRTYIDSLSTDQIKGLARKVLPERLSSKVKGKKSDMVETVFQTIDDAHEGGGRLDNVEQGVAVSWAPDILGGGRPGIVSDPFSPEGLSVFESEMEETEVPSDADDA